MRSAIFPEVDLGLLFIMYSILSFGLITTPISSFSTFNMPLFVNYQLKCFLVQCQCMQEAGHIETAKNQASKKFQTRTL